MTTKTGAKLFRAGCGRVTHGPADLTELAYIDLAYPECPGCIHCLDPDDAPSFCRWCPQHAPHPFAALAALEL